MDKTFVRFAVLASIAILCQWVVFASFRKYLFKRYATVARTVAYPVLIGLGFMNYAAVELTYSTQVFPHDAAGRNIMAVAYFNYLGCVLVFVLFFLAVGAVSFSLSAAGWTWSSLRCWLTGRPGAAANYRKGLGGPAPRPRAVRMVPRTIGQSPPPEERGSFPNPDASYGRKSSRLEKKLADSSTGYDSGPEKANALPLIEHETAQSSAAVQATAPVRGPGQVRGQSNEFSRRPNFPRRPPPTRREFLKWSTATGMCGIFGLAGQGTASALGEPVMGRMLFEHPSLTGLNRPVTLIHVTDFHFGMFFGVEQLEHLVATLNSLDGDALLITGDVFHSPVTPVESAVRPLQALRSRRFGNFVVMGNHDFYADEGRTTSAFERARLTMLRNRWATFKQGAGVLHFGGIDDPLEGWFAGRKYPNFHRFAETIPKGPGMRILLSHRPAVLPYAAEAEIDLVLAGHIHGGQIVLPRLGRERGTSLAEIASDYTYGWYSKGKTRMYLNRGVGTTFVPWRINCPPEIAVIQLQAPENYPDPGNST